MSDDIQYIDVDSEDYEDAPRPLREAYKKLVKANATLTKERDEARTVVQSRQVADVLAGQNFKNPERVKQALLADRVDPGNQTAVDAWLAANGDDYAKAAPEGEKKELPAPVVTPEEQQQIQQLGALQGTNPDAQGYAEKFATVTALITPQMSEKDVEALYREHGI